MKQSNYVGLCILVDSFISNFEWGTNQRRIMDGVKEYPHIQMKANIQVSKESPWVHERIQMIECCNKLSFVELQTEKTNLDNKFNFMLAWKIEKRRMAQK